GFHSETLCCFLRCRSLLTLVVVVFGHQRNQKPGFGHGSPSRLDLRWRRENVYTSSLKTYRTRLQTSFRMGQKLLPPACCVTVESLHMDQKGYLRGSACTRRGILLSAGLRSSVIVAGHSRAGLTRQKTQIGAFASLLDMLDVQPQPSAIRQ